MKTWLAIFVIMCGCGRDANERTKHEDAPEEHAIANYSEMSIHDKDSGRGHIGVLVAEESVNVPAQTRGIIRSVLVDIGDSVVAGQAIATMDTRTMKSDLAIALANANAASAKARRLQVQMEAAERLYRRHADVGEDVISTQDIDAAKAMAASSAAAFAEASAATSAERSRVSQLRDSLAETTIKAPFAGKIAQRLVTPGESVELGAAIVLLITAESLQVDFVVPLGEQGDYRVGDNITVNVDSTEATLDGIVRRIAPNLDPITQMTTMEATLLDDQAGLETLQAGVGVWVSPSSN